MKKITSLAVAVLLASSIALPIAAHAQTVSVDNTSYLEARIASLEQLLTLLEQLLAIEQSTAGSTVAVAPVQTQGNITTATSTQSVSSTAPDYTAPAVVTQNVVVTPQAPVASVSAPQPTSTVITVTQNASFSSTTVSTFDNNDTVGSFILTNNSSLGTYVNEVQIVANAPFLQDLTLMVSGAQQGSQWANPRTGSRQVLGGDIYVAGNSSVEVDFVANITAAATGTFPSTISFCGASAEQGTVQDANSNTLNPYATCPTPVAGQTITVQ